MNNISSKEAVMHAHRFLVSLVAVILVSVAVSGCQSSGGGKRLTPMAADFSAMPGDAAAVTAAVEERLSSGSNADGVQFTGAATNAPILPWLADEGFAFTGARLYRHLSAGSGGPGYAAGQVVYQDALDRRTAYLFSAHYTDNGAGGYTVSKLDIAPEFVKKPRVRFSILPVDALQGGGVQARSLADLMQVVARSGITPGQEPAGSQDYFLVAIGLDPISTSARLEVRVSKKKTGAGGFAKGASQYALNGWPVAFLPGRLDLHGNKKLYAKTVFTPGKEVGLFQRGAKLVGLYPVYQN